MYSKIILSLLSLNLCVSISTAQINFWKPGSIKETNITESKILPLKYKVIELNTQGLRSMLLEQKSLRKNESIQIMLPDPEGKLISFTLKISPIMEPGLAAKYPHIVTFTLKNSSFTGRGSITQFGLHAMLLSAGETYYIDPLSNLNDTDHQVYFKSDFTSREPLSFSCEVEKNQEELPSIGETTSDPEIKSYYMGQKRSAAVNLRTYRLALACTGEYAQFHGGNVSSVMAQMVIAINRVNTVYENDLAVRLIIIDGNDQLIYLDGDTDPYANNSGSTMLGQNQTTVNETIGSANYDIGHVFSTGGGGIAQLRSVCGNGKARGVTGLGSPTGDPFYIDYVCHEIGHQFGGNHTFNNCDGNENPTTSFEPGSGSTIMAYAGICGAANNVQFRSDDYFHVGSLEEIFSFSRNGSGNTCATIIPTDNADPVATILSPNNKVIPISTPFELEGVAVDDTLQTLQYNWEQYDTGPISTMGSPIGNSPLFRSLKPGTNPVRIFPALTNVLNGSSTTREVLPTTSRPLNFKFIARDFAENGGGVHWVSLSMSSTSEAGPFNVLSPASLDTVVVGSVVQIKWDVANTDKAPVNCQFVDILYSRNGGNAFTDTLAKNVPNSGAAFVIIPDGTTNQGRVKIKAVGNVFFNVNPGNFRVVDPVAPTFSFIAAAPSELICVPNNISLPIETRALLGYEHPIQLEVINSSVQNDITFTFLENPLTPGSNTSLEINVGEVAEPISFQIMATGQDADTIIFPIQLFTQLALNSEVTLVAPESGSSGVTTVPVFEWGIVNGATVYELEISTNPDFADSEFSLEVEDTSSALNEVLLQNTLYFWRVRGINDCSNTDWSNVSTFYTALVDCETYEETVDIGISASGTPTVTSIIEIDNDIELTDVFITGIRGNHSWFNELEFFLSGPDGTEIILVQRKCGAAAGAFNFGFSDESLTEFLCPPNQMKQSLPAQPFSAFQGKRSAGNWTLSVKDTRATSGGRLLGWTLGICGPVNSSQPDLIRNELMVLKPGNQRFLNSDFLLVSDQSVAEADIKYILVTTPEKGNLLRNGEILQVGDEFTQTEISNNSILYEHLSDLEEEDSFDFVVLNGNGGWIDISTFQINTDEDFTSSTSEKGLDYGFKVFPNPAGTILNLVMEGKEGFTEIQILNQLGQVIKVQKLTNAANQAALDVNQITTGSYFVRILGKELTITKAFVVAR
jgi:hypothetical protein